jgi:hypothetical protein
VGWRSIAAVLENIERDFGYAANFHPHVHDLITD